MSHDAAPPSVPTAYAGVRERIVSLLRNASTEDCTTPVLACPGWTVADLAAHVAGLAEDVLAGRVEGAGSAAWTAAQVERHRGDSLADLADSLETNAAAFDAALPHIPAPVNARIVMDSVTHEHDLRAALGVPGERNSDAVTIGLNFLLDGRREHQPELVATLTSRAIDPWDLLRALSGRRTLDQIAELGLDVDAVTAGFAGSVLSAPAAPVE